jgi:serine/threonine protein kinase
MTNLIGQSLGRYHILEQLGEGGMATVYKAFDTRLEREVAVKVIRVDQFSPAVLERVLKRFEREAKSMSRLSHPNIVKVLDYGDYEGSPYLVLEYLPGGTLKRRLGKPLPWSEAIRLLLPIAHALEYAHQQGVIHRDVKPSNILITTSGEPMLTDFGIAKLLEADEGQTLTATGVGIGTPEYMSPEQGMGREIDARADVYSLGIVLYELVTGHKPYVADTPMAVVLKHVTDPLPRPQRFVPDLPDAVEKVLLKALAKEPQNRYPGMEMFAENLERLASEAVKGSPRAALPPTSRREDTQATILQETDTQATRDQDIDSVLFKTIPPPKKPAQTARSWRKWLPAGIAVFLFIVCGGMVAVVWIMNGGPTRGDGTVETQPLAPIVSENGTSTTNTEPTAVAIIQPEVVTSTSAPVATSTQISIPTSILLPPPTNTKVPTKPSSNPTGKIVFTCQMSRLADYNEICLMNVDGSNYYQLTSNGSNNVYASLSPDGKSVVYASKITGTWQIYEINLSSGSTWKITSGTGDSTAPEISPNGQEIAYHYSDPIDSIWVMNRDGNNPHKIYSPGWDPVWSPDGSQILFASGNIGQAQLYIINSNGSNRQQITNQNNLPGRSDWSIGGLITFYTGTSWMKNIFTMNSNGSGVTQVTDGGNSQGPSFSPDGNWIVFTGYFDNMNDMNGCEIYIMRVDGSDMKRLTYNNYCDWQPRWGP